MTVEQLREALQEAEKAGFAKSLVSIEVTNATPSLHCAVVQVQASRSIHKWPVLRIQAVAER